MSNPNWTPGVSGNPSGKPKDPTKALAKKYSEEALETIYQLMQSSAVAPKVRVLAAEIILNRAWGKPTTSVELTGAEGGPLLIAPVDAPPQETREQWIARRTKEMLERAPTVNPIIELNN